MDHYVSDHHARKSGVPVQAAHEPYQWHAVDRKFAQTDLGYIFKYDPAVNTRLRTSARASRSQTTPCLPLRALDDLSQDKTQLNRDQRAGRYTGFPGLR